MEARWANPARIKSVPFVPAGAGPEVILARRPAAQWTSNARAGRLEILFLLNLAI